MLQGDNYAELTRVAATFGSDASIGGFNVDGRFNVKNPVYGARGDGLTDDTAAIQAAYNAACSAAIAATSANANQAETLWFPAGVYITSSSLISNCSQPITWKCEGEGACMIKAVSQGLFPIIMHEANSYLNGITTQGPILASSLAAGSGSSLNWGANSQAVLRFERCAERAQRQRMEQRRADQWTNRAQRRGLSELRRWRKRQRLRS